MSSVPGPGNKLSQGAVRLHAVGHDQQLVPGVELHQRAGRPSPGHGVAPPLQGEDPRDEILPDGRVAQPAVVLEGQVREMAHDHPGPQPGAVSSGHAARAVDLDPRHAVGGRAVAEYPAAEVLLFQERESFSRPRKRMRSVQSSPEFRPTRRGFSGSPASRTGSRGMDMPHSASGQTGTHSTNCPRVSRRKGSSLWVPS